MSPARTEPANLVTAPDQMALPVDTTSDAEPPSSSPSSRATSPTPLPLHEEQPTYSHHPSRGRPKKKKTVFRGTPQWAKTPEHPVMFAAHAPAGIESPNLIQDNGTSVPATTPSIELRRSGRERKQRLCYNPTTGESTRPIAVSDDP